MQHLDSITGDVGFWCAILGPSGSGKSPASSLFKCTSWEPHRIREARNAKESSICKTVREYDLLLAEQQRLYSKPLHSEAGLVVFNDWSFFDVRGSKQCLEHRPAAKGGASSLRLEVFGPVLVKLVRNHEACRDAFDLDPRRLIVFLFNPTGTSFWDMSSPSVDLCLATQFAIAERAIAQGKPEDLTDIQRRIRYLHQEINAWREFWRLGTAGVIELLEWEHLEYRYYVDPTGELIRARTSILGAIQEQAPELSEKVLNLLRTEEEIAAMSGIV